MSQVSQVTAFGNYLVNTREARLTDPKDIVNDLTLQNYSFPHFARNDAMGVNISGGTEVSDTIKLLEFSNTRSYIPGEVRTPTRGQTDVRMKVPWRFYETDRPIIEPEVDTNEGDQFAQWKHFEHSLMTDLNTDHCNRLERSLFQRPNFTLMETRSQIIAGEMQSLPLFLCENGISPPGWGATNTIQQVRPDNTPRWRNEVAVYDHLDPSHPFDGLFAAFSDAIRRTNFVPWRGKEKWMQGANLVKNGVILSNRAGVNLFENLLRQTNSDTRIGPQDPAYPSPQFQGIPVEHVAALDDSLLGQTGAVIGDASNPGTYTGSPWASDQPRFMLINKEFMKIWFHRDHMLRETDPKDGGATQRDVVAIYKESWVNTFCRSRRRHCLIRPLAPTG